MAQATQNPHQKPTPVYRGMDLSQYNIFIEPSEVFHNAPVPVLYELAMQHEHKSTMIVENGALLAFSGLKTGRSPGDKRIVAEDTTKDDIWWGKVNIPLTPEVFKVNKQRVIDFLNTRERLYVIDGYAGWDPTYRIKVRVICSRAYHALFMWDMLIRPSEKELLTFGDPDWVIYNAGEFPANPYTSGMTSNASVDLCFISKEFIILGTQYAGEMKKGVFTIMNYLMPKQGLLSLHSSCNVGKSGTTLFFGLSGTGKTTLSADPHRRLVGDDEHVWSDQGVFNIEGGCYAKVINLKKEEEPEIYNAVRFGAVLENCGVNPATRVVDYSDLSITANTRVAYPLEFIENSQIPAITGHPNNVLLLTCDTFGVLPPVSRLTRQQVMYWFMIGYTSKAPGTEVGINQPEATFSSCFAAPFLVWHPVKYATLLAEKLTKYKASAWLVNTGWTGGAYGAGTRCKLRYTRAIIDAIHNGDLDEGKVETELLPIFNLIIPKTCPGVPPEMLNPRNTWQDKDAYDKQSLMLANLFLKNFKIYEDKVSEDVKAGGPVLPE